MKKILFLIYLLLGLVGFGSQATAQSLAEILPMSAVAQILRPNDSQGIGLGLTGVAYREGLFSTYSNPAGLKLDNLHFSFSHVPATKMFGSVGVNQEAFAIGLPIDRNLMLGLQFFNLNYGVLETSDLYGNLIERGRAGLREFQISGSKVFAASQSEFAVGLSVKYLQFYWPDWDAGSLLVDAGVRYGVNHERTWYSFGVSVSNLGNELKHNDFTWDKPIQLLRLGIAVGKMASSDSSLGLLGTIEYQRSLNDDELHAEWNHLGIGLELQFTRYLFSRLGYNFDLSEVNKDDKIRGLTYGLGFNTPAKIKIILPVELSVNYGRGITDYRGLDANVVSVDVGFDLQ